MTFPYKKHVLLLQEKIIVLQKHQKIAKCYRFCNQSPISTQKPSKSCKIRIVDRNGQINRLQTVDLNKVCWLSKKKKQKVARITIPKYCAFFTC